MEKVLIVVDMQNDFVTGVLGSEAAAAVTGGIRDKLERYRREGNGILFTMDTHLEDDYSGVDMPVEARAIPKHCIRGTPGWEVVPELAPYARGNTVQKPAFLSDTLADVIRERFDERVELELCGVCTDICVVSNALALRAAFPKAVIRCDASLCAGTSDNNHAAALAVMRSCLIEVA